MGSSSRSRRFVAERRQPALCPKCPCHTRDEESNWLPASRRETLALRSYTCVMELRGGRWQRGPYHAGSDHDPSSRPSNPHLLPRFHGIQLAIPLEFTCKACPLVIFELCTFTEGQGGVPVTQPQLFLQQKLVALPPLSVRARPTGVHLRTTKKLLSKHSRTEQDTAKQNRTKHVSETGAATPSTGSGEHPKVTRPVRVRSDWRRASPRSLV